MKNLILILLIQVSFYSNNLLSQETKGNANTQSYTIHTSQNGDSINYRFEDNDIVLTKLLNSQTFSIRNLPYIDKLNNLNPTQLLDKLSDKLNDIQERLDAIQIINDILGDHPCPHTQTVKVKKREKEERKREGDVTENKACDITSLYCFPNPSRGVFNLVYDSKESKNPIPIILSSMEGAIITTQIIPQDITHYTIPYQLTQLPKGQYIISAPCGNTYTSLNISIQ